MAGPAGIGNTVAGGYDPRPGFEREFVVYIWLEGGWGGRPGKRDNHVSMCIYATSATNQPMEQQERLVPIMFDAQVAGLLSCAGARMPLRPPCHR